MEHIEESFQNMIIMSMYNILYSSCFVTIVRASTLHRLTLDQALANISDYSVKIILIDVLSWEHERGYAHGKPDLSSLFESYRFYICIGIDQ